MTYFVRCRPNWWWRCVCNGYVFVQLPPTLALHRVQASILSDDVNPSTLTRSITVQVKICVSVAALPKHADPCMEQNLGFVFLAGFIGGQLLHCEHLTHGSHERYIDMHISVPAETPKDATISFTLCSNFGARSTSIDVGLCRVLVLRTKPRCVVVGLDAECQVPLSYATLSANPSSTPQLPTAPKKRLAPRAEGRPRKTLREPLAQHPPPTPFKYDAQCDSLV